MLKRGPKPINVHKGHPLLAGSVDRDAKVEPKQGRAMSPRKRQRLLFQRRVFLPSSFGARFALKGATPFAVKGASERERRRCQRDDFRLTVFSLPTQPRRPCPASFLWVDPCKTAHRTPSFFVASSFDQQLLLQEWDRQTN